MSESPVTDEENPAQAVGTAGVRGALARYRVMAYIVGVGLLALCAAMILKYAFDQDQYVAIVGPVHGFLYIVYLVAVVDLALKARWSMQEHDPGDARRASCRSCPSSRSAG